MLYSTTVKRKYFDPTKLQQLTLHVFLLIYWEIGYSRSRAYCSCRLQCRLPTCFYSDVEIWVSFLKLCFFFFIMFLLKLSIHNVPKNVLVNVIKNCLSACLSLWEVCNARVDMV